MSFTRINFIIILLLSILLFYSRFCEGGDLLTRLAFVNHFTEHKAARILQQTLAAIDACHKKNIVHRDLKLENILFEDSSADSTVKLIDFGQSRIIMSSEENEGFTGSVLLYCYW
jgi:serine/threonine protein kinase